MLSMTALTVGAETTETPPPDTEAKKFVAFSTVPRLASRLETTPDCAAAVVTTLAVIMTEAAVTVRATAEVGTPAAAPMREAISDRRDGG